MTLPIRIYEPPPEEPLPAPQQQSAPDVPWAELPRLDDVTVLVVDNEIDARQIVAAILLQKGATVVEAASAEEALDLARHRDPDLIVSDIAMPGTDGYEMMRRFRQGSCRFVPAIALTACVAPDDVAAALSAGYQKHLEKPVYAPELIRVAWDLAVAPRSLATGT